MNLASRVAQLRDALQREGGVWTLRRIAEELIATVAAPWQVLYWMPLAEFQVRSVDPAFDMRTVRSPKGLSGPDRSALQSSIGSGAMRIFDDRLKRGHVLHLLFRDGHVVGTTFFVLGHHQSFQHVVLTERDAMTLDARIDPRYRGRGWYPVLLALSVQSLREEGIERLFIDASERNERAIRTMRRLGFRFLLRYRESRSRYRFDWRAA